ncbi:hypothetical protein HDV64DRAFT_111838 [Trichoderma sp. TUCIM 5745]
MSKRKLNSGPAQSRKRTKLDGPQDGPRTRRAGRSSPSPPPRASSSLATADAGQGQRSKRKRTDGPNDDSNKDSSKEPATKRPEPFPRDSTEAHRPRGALESPPRSPPPALQQEQSAAMPALVDVGARLLFENSLVAVGTRPEQEEEASDGEESGSESISSERQTASRQSTPSTVRQSPPLQRQPPKKKAKKVKKVKKAKKAKKAKEAGMTQDRKRPPPAAIEDLLRSRRSTRRDKGCTLWCLGDNGAACPVASSR